MDRNPPILNHNSRGRSTSSCNCGRKQAPREDPFDIQAANYDFYQVSVTQQRSFFSLTHIFIATFSQILALTHVFDDTVLPE